MCLTLRVRVRVSVWVRVRVRVRVRVGFRVRVRARVSCDVPGLCPSCRVHVSFMVYSPHLQSWTCR